MLARRMSSCRSRPRAAKPGEPGRRCSINLDGYAQGTPGGTPAAGSTRCGASHASTWLPPDAPNALRVARRPVGGHSAEGGTPIGPGGVGKTRVALVVALELVDALRTTSGSSTSARCVMYRSLWEKTRVAAPGQWLGAESGRPYLHAVSGLVARTKIRTRRRQATNEPSTRQGKTGHGVTSNRCNCIDGGITFRCSQRCSSVASTTSRP
jgi:hypothetical protein